MIHLEDQDMIASSKTRNCYLHPSDSDKVIKIVKEQIPPGERDANSKEWAHYQYLKKLHPRLNIISTYHGFVETNLGQGLLIDCIRDYDGRVSMRAHKILLNRARHNLDNVETAMKRLCQKIVENNIQLFDLNMFNILIQILPDGKFRPVCVDIKGRYNNYEFIPVSTYIPYFSRRKLERRCRQLMQNVKQLCQKSDQQYRLMNTMAYKGIRTQNKVNPSKLSNIPLENQIIHG